MNANIKPMSPINLATFDFQAQFKLCEHWNDPDQWDALGVLYFQCGYLLNARHCFERADACREFSLTPAPALSGTRLPLGEGFVAVETEVE